jgi:hypothetical protein
VFFGTGHPLLSHVQCKRKPNSENQVGLESIFDLIDNFYRVAYSCTEPQISEKAVELLTAIRGLDERDLDELIRYAQFRRAATSTR